jgi:hypothetical protein
MEIGRRAFLEASLGATGTVSAARIIPTSRCPKPYFGYRFWPGISSLTGPPATSAFAGLGLDGLPVGIQVPGP